MPGRQAETGSKLSVTKPPRCDADETWWSIQQPPRLSGHVAETRNGAEFLIILQVEVVDAHFAGLDTIHYLFKVWVFYLQSITDQ